MFSGISTLSMMLRVVSRRVMRFLENGEPWETTSSAPPRLALMQREWRKRFEVS
jgi:hypothetical protein